MDSDDVTKICIAAVAISFFIMISSCQQTAEEIQAEAQLITETTKQLQVTENAETERETARLEKMHLLIDEHNVSTFAARCAVFGPNSDYTSDNELCAEASGVKTD